MSKTGTDSGVLKLVHPGGLVEIRKSSITAAEVMRVNPKHCVTRPDVFKYPWIVVRPESVLRPGSVFYVVPHHTMRKLLLKAKEKEDKQDIKNQKENKQVQTGKGNQEKVGTPRLGIRRSPRGGNKQSRVANYDQSVAEYTSVDLSHFESVKEMAPSNAADHKEIHKSSRIECYGSEALAPSRFKVKEARNHQVITSRNTEMQKNHDRKVPGYRRRHPIETELKENSTLEGKHQQQPKLERQESQAKPIHVEITVQQPAVGRERTVDSVSENFQEINDLKSCLKTRKSSKTTRVNLRVRFMFPGDEEKNMRTQSWLLEASSAAP